MTDATAATIPSLAMTLRSLMRADLTVLARSRQTVILNLAVPLVIVAVTSRGNLGRGAGFVVGLAITYGLLSSALMGYSAMVARDRELGVFDGLRVTPTPPWAIMLSRLVVQLAANLVTSIVVMAVGSLILHVRFGAVEYLLMVAISVLGAAMFLSIGQALAGLVRSAAAVSAVSRVAYAVLLLVGLLGLTGALGDGFERFADWTPVGALINLFAAALSLAPWSRVDTYAIVASVGYIVVFGVVGIRWFRWTAQ